jgi:hypothetical protein
LSPVREASVSAFGPTDAPAGSMARPAPAPDTEPQVSPAFEAQTQAGGNTMDDAKP